MIIVRKLLTVLGYKIDDAQLKTYDAQLNNTKKSIAGITDVAKAAALALGAMFAGKVAQDVLTANVEYEKLISRLTTLEGVKAPGIFDQLAKFAAETPNQLNDIVDSYIKLKAAGFEVNQDVLQQLGDLGATSGKSFGEVTEIILSANRGLGSMVDNLAGLSAQSAGGILLLKNAMTGMTAEVAAGDTKNLLAFFTAAGKAPQVAGGMQRLSLTLGGLLSTLKDAVDEFYRTIGQDGGAADALRETLTLLTQLVQGNKSAAVSFGEALADGIRRVNAGLKLLADNIDAVKSGVQTAGKVAVVALLPILWPLLLLEDLLAAIRGEESVLGDLFGGQLEGAAAKIGLVVDEVMILWGVFTKELQPSLNELSKAFLELFGVIAAEFGTGDFVVGSLTEAVRLFGNVLIVGMREALPVLKTLIGWSADAVRLFADGWPIIRYVLGAVVTSLKVVAAIIAGPTLAAIGALFLAVKYGGQVFATIWPIIKHVLFATAEALLLVGAIIFGPLLLGMGLLALAAYGLYKVVKANWPLIKSMLLGIAYTLGGVILVILGPALLAVGLLALAFYGIYKAVMYFWQPLKLVLYMMAGSLLLVAAIIFGPLILGMLALAGVAYMIYNLFLLVQSAIGSIGEIIGAAIGGGVDAAKAKLDELMSKVRSTFASIARLDPTGTLSSIGGGGSSPGAGAAAGASAAPGARAGGASNTENTVNAGGLVVNIQGNANMAPGEIANAAQAGTQQGLRDFSANLAGGLA